jgi:hypothetical protein
MEGTRKRGRPRKRWRDDAEEELYIMGINKGQTIAGDRRRWRNILGATKVRYEMQRLRRRRRRRRRIRRKEEENKKEKKQY